MKIWDRPPSVNSAARFLGTAAVLGLAQPAAVGPEGKTIDAEKVMHFMPALIIHAIVLQPGVEQMDYTAAELLYDTDAYRHLLWQHFESRGSRSPAVLADLSLSTRGPRLLALWDGRHVS